MAHPRQNVELYTVYDYPSGRQPEFDPDLAFRRRKGFAIR